MISEKNAKLSKEKLHFSKILTWRLTKILFEFDNSIRSERSIAGSMKNFMDWKVTLTFTNQQQIFSFTVIIVTILIWSI